MSRARLLALLIVEVAAMSAVMGGVLFIAAGSWSWPGGWRFLLTFVALSMALSLWLLATDPALLLERLKPPMQAGQKPWDRIFMGLVGVCFLAWVALIGLDGGRFGWSHVPAWLQTTGGLLLAVGFLGVGWVFSENSFAAPVVRVQADRGQQVIDTGPYAIVRHPMYAFSLPIFVGAPLLAGSWWALAAAPLAMLGIAARALGEERVLTTELPGYDDYARRVRWRFAPGVW